MDINSIPKKYLLGAIGALVVILLVVTLISPTSFHYSNNGPTAEDQAKSQALQKEYAEYLASIKPDPEASKKLFEQVIDQNAVQNEVAATLKTNQKIVIPVVPDSKLNITKDSGQVPVQQYFSAIEPVIKEFADTMEPEAGELFTNGDKEQASLATIAAIDKLYKTPVPQEAVAYQKAQINTMEQVSGLVKTAQASENADTTSPIWPEMYQQYAVIDNQMGQVKSEFNKLDKQYGLTSPLPGQAELAAGNPFIKSAHAQFAVTIVGDIPGTIEKVIKEALAAAFAKFMNLFVDKLIGTIQNNYYIANFLYYTDALVRGQYVNDYLDKYVGNAVDKQIIERFIPQFACANGTKEDLQKIFVAKARQYLGFDPATIDPNSSNFYTQIAKLPDLFPEIQELSYKEKAQAAIIQANQAAILEQLSPSATKLPRSDTLSGQIAATASSINASIQAAFNAKIGLGNSTPTNGIVSNIVSTALTAFINKYLFKGVVLKEQSTCIQLPQLQPVIPGDTTPTVFDENPDVPLTTP